MINLSTPNTNNTAYERVAGDEEDVNSSHASLNSQDDQPQSTSSSSNKNILSKIQQYSVTIICISIFIGTAIIAYILVHYLSQISHSQHGQQGAHLHSIATNTTTTSCGSSPSEAKALGCTWDVFINGWVPASCYNPLVASNSESAKTYDVFWDSRHTRPATLEDLQWAAFNNTGKPAAELHFFHTERDWHGVHCLHLWRLVASAAESVAKGVKGVGVYSKSAELKHAMHCSKIIMNYDEARNGDLGAISPTVARCVGLDDVWDLSYGGI